MRRPQAAAHLGLVDFDYDWYQNTGVRWLRSVRPYQNSPMKRRVG